MKRSAALRGLWVVVGLHLVLGLAYDWATPIFEAPDEGYHFAVIRRLGQGKGLPVQRPGEVSEWAQEGSQPPLYYVVTAALTKWLDMRDWEAAFVWNPFSQIGVPGAAHNVNFYRHAASESFPYRGTALAVHVARWWSLALSALTVLLTYRLARTISPRSTFIPLLSAAFVALNPKALFINASVNNDNLLMPLSTAALLVTLHFIRPAVKGYGWKAAGLGAVLGAAALTKVSGLVLWPVAALGVAWGAYRGRDGRRLIVSGAVIAGTALLVSGWWFWRNQQLYGEWLGLNTMVAVAGPRQPALGVVQLIQEEWRGFFLSYWGVFGVFTILPGEWVHLFFTSLTLWAVLGCVWWLIGQHSVGHQPAWPELGLLAVACVLTLMGVVRWTMQTYASQGRLMFGVIAPLSVFMAAGILATIPQRRRGAATFALVSALAVVAGAIPFAYIAPRYAPPPVVEEAALPAGLHRVHARFGDAFELIGYTADQSPRAPGEAQRVTLYWRALNSMETDYALALHLLGRERAEVAKIDTWPGGGNAPTSQWTAGQILADTYRLPIAADAVAPGLLRLDVGAWHGEPTRTLSITSPSGQRLDSVLLTVGRLVPRQPPQFAPAIAERAAFEAGIELLGAEVRTNGALSLELYWRAEREVAVDYTVFVHLMDAQGLRVAQADAPPLSGDWPTSAWVPGLAFADPRVIALPPGLPPGSYSVRVGLYDPLTTIRLRAVRPDGTPWANDAVVFENVLEVR